MKLSLIVSLFTLSLHSLAEIPTQDSPCYTPVDCHYLQQQKRAEALRIKEEREQATFRQEQLELQAAQLKELQEQRAVQEKNLASQQRMEEIKVKEMEEAEKSKRLEKPNEKN